MNSLNDMVKYAEELGGVFNFDELEAIPYNHWKKDFEWLVFIMDYPGHAAWITVTALTPREACQEAIKKYTETIIEEEDDI